ncbi:MAG TPA: ADP-ribosylation factor-like protein [Candidatus Lokiarchaeia archaeon]|nr:ADP-ribosylation factor-like protein [Candidatus Lokiarchaeia archaeon]
MQGLKIVFAGLDSAGKTSFLNTLEEKYSTLTKIKPTLGPDRREFTIFGFTVSNWDLGGQSVYRNSYLQPDQKTRYFSQISTLFFILDVQDTGRDNEAFEYLKAIIDTLIELDEKPNIVVCWHKCDKDIETKPETVARIQKLEAKLASVVAPFKVKTFKTTIFDKWTLLKAFSQGLISVSPKAVIIESQLTDFARKTFSSAVMLLDSNHLTLGVHTSTPELLEFCEAIVPHVASTADRVQGYDISLSNMILSAKPGKYYAEMIQGKEMVMLFIPLKVGEFNFSLLSITKNPKNLKLLLKHSETLASNMHDIVKSFYF